MIHKPLVRFIRDIMGRYYILQDILITEYAIHDIYVESTIFQLV